MENKAHAMAAGAFVLVVTALLALLAIWLTRDNTQRDLYDMASTCASSATSACTVMALPPAWRTCRTTSSAARELLA